ncbi:6-phospho-3-hexuloisomerase [Clavibacter michiganensis]|uniref:3-hexulose-6-phosphate isomerase n=1 Tax=Clavibacter michiganensis subsp. michiganensis TaxID=33013 RepID=A0A225CZL4_CLAMM|nr:6-phospho-3-hexuloisomerase [Clavibacter michiganensis]MBF4636382.1 6-phospho-3-hexuloisomerase [Clavibacter michiganensis subsp. michiganensis]MDO4029010.1 6-phospho-3-hexuloisomerase [Clavibacter michiganensis]MDO4064904.1 6-phospho-3-hexuloisomerase [Clavibacter michiganensis]MDO4072218.1 6-phospho-3-hexuloisomerase [Clavibacter michiganensis]MDO4089981.1 6-phospho-3-hexuloisomerase [Clavibacter michiganensis]
MTNTTHPRPSGDSPVDVAAAMTLISDENARVARALTDPDLAARLDEAARVIRDGRRVFALGAGRSGLALRMTAMRFMHLGLDAHVVGEATSPAIEDGDVLLVASGSGTTASIVSAAETAHEVGARIVALTTADDSPLADLADVTVLIPAAAKQDHGGTVSAQYAGGLFELSVALVGDAVFHALWQASGLTADELWPRHANLE